MSAKDRCELEPLFAPPPGECGTHLLLCGLSADVETLERIMAAFTNEAPAQRGAAGLVRGWLLLDASVRRSPAQPVPGLLHIAPCLKEQWRARTTLMHAKVALMGFGPSRYAAPDRWRLVVSTGNWTTQTWEHNAQIDLFWTDEWSAQQPLDGESAQSLCDMHAALAFFRRVLEGLHGYRDGEAREGPLASAWLQTWSQALRLRGAARQCRPRFVHSLDEPLVQLMQQRFPQAGVSTLVAGSGFFEQGEDMLEGPVALAELEKLGRENMDRYLVFNPSRAGAIAGWIAQLGQRARDSRKLAAGQAGRWWLCRPRDPLEKKANAGRSFLHAKYVAGLTAVRDREATGKIVFLYIGSGNLSRRGVLSRAQLTARGGARQRSVGNVEAGVILQDCGRFDRLWQRLACGDLATPQDIAGVVAGAGGEMFEPLDPPPLLLLREGAAILELVRSEVPPTPLWLQAVDGGWTRVETGQESVQWTMPAPASVRVRAHDPVIRPDAEEWDVPVLSRDGLLCRRPAPQLPMSSVLQALLAFPESPAHAQEDDDPGTPAGKGSGSRFASTRYPLRTLAALVEAIAQRNALVTREEFPYWLSQLRTLLLEQAAGEERAAIGRLGVDLFQALDQPGFAPPWLPQEPRLEQEYSELLQRLRAAWHNPRPEDA